MSIVTTHFNNLEDMYITASNIFKSISDIYLNQKDFTLIHVGANGIIDGSESSDFFKGSYKLVNINFPDINEHRYLQADIELDQDLSGEFSTGKFLVRFIDTFTNYEYIKELTLESIEYNSINGKNILIFTEEILQNIISNVNVHRNLIVNEYPESESKSVINNKVTLKGGLLDINVTSWLFNGFKLQLNTDGDFDPLWDLMTIDAGSSVAAIRPNYPVQIKVLLEKRDPSDQTLLDSSFVYAIPNLNTLDGGENGLNLSDSHVLNLIYLDKLMNANYVIGETTHIKIYKVFDKSVITNKNYLSLYSGNTNFKITEVDAKYEVITDSNGTFSFIDFITFTTDTNVLTNKTSYPTIGLTRNYTNTSYYSEYTTSSTPNPRTKLSTILSSLTPIYGCLKEFTETSNLDGYYDFYMSPLSNGNNVDVTVVNTGSFFFKTIDELGEYYSLPTQAFFTKLNNVKEELLTYKYNSSLDKNEIYLNKDVQIPVKIKMDNGEYTKFYLYNKLDIKVDGNIPNLVTEDAGANLIVSAYVYYHSTLEYKGFKLGIKVRNSVDNFELRYPNETLIGGFFVSSSKAKEVIDVKSIWDVYNMPDIDIESLLIDNIDTEYHWRKLDKLNKYYRYSDTIDNMYLYPLATKQDIIYAFSNNYQEVIEGDNFDIKDGNYPKYILEKSIGSSTSYVYITKDSSEGNYIIDETTSSDRRLRTLFMVNGKRR